jgi:hypothetical protein
MHKWPWSYNRCDGSVPDLTTKQEISACDATPGFGLHPHQGRGAPEIDIFEVMPGHNMPGHEGLVRPFMSTSLQVSPGVTKPRKRPKNGEKLGPGDTWYTGLQYDPARSSLNDGFWGQECGPEYDSTTNQIYKYQEDALSVNTDLNHTHFSAHHIYRLEWEPSSSAGGGYLQWYLDDEFIFGIDGDDLAATTGAMIPTEPMYLILNTAISHRWGMPEPCDIAHCPMCWRCYDCTNPECQCSLPDGMKGCKNLPAEMSIDYIRLYQDADNPTHTLGCSPPAFPTADYIAAHAAYYADWKPAEGGGKGWHGVRGVAEAAAGLGTTGVLAVFVLLVLALIYSMWLRATSTTSSYSYTNVAASKLVDVSMPSVKSRLLTLQPTSNRQVQHSAGEQLNGLLATDSGIGLVQQQPQPSGATAGMGMRSQRTRKLPRPPQQLTPSPRRDQGGEPQYYQQLTST